MRRAIWLSSGVAMLPLLAHAAGGGWGAGGGSVAVDSTARATAASALGLAQSSLQQSRNLGDLGNPSAALGNLGGVPASMIGSPSGVAGLNASALVPAAQIPFGSVPGSVADGGMLTAAAAKANAAIPSSVIGAASGVASLGANRLLPASQIPFGAVSGTVADGGMLAATAATASAAIPGSMIGAASGVASLGANKLLPTSQIPFGTASGMVADGGSLAATAAAASAAIPSSMIGAASGVASLGANKLLPTSQIPFGTASGMVADGGSLAAAAAAASAAIPSSMIGAASGVASLGSNKLLTASQIPFGSAAGTVADGGALAAATTMIGSALQPGGSGSALVFTPTGSSSGTTGAALAALAAGAIPGSMIGAASGVASLGSNKLLTASQIPFGSTAGTVADGGALATAATMIGSALQPGGSGSALVFTPTGSSSGTTGAALAALAAGAVPSSMIGAASGVAALNGAKMLPTSQIPFGTTAGTVADGGMLSTVAATANAAIPSSMIGAASGVASLNGSKLLTAAQVPFGTTTGTVADGGALATATTMIGSALQPGGSGSALVFTPTGSSIGTTGAALAALAAGAIPSSMIGAASGVAALNGAKLLPASQIPFGTAAGTVADGAALAATTTMAGSALQPGGSGGALIFTPTGSSSGTTGAALAALATGAIPSSMIGAASGVAALNGAKLLTASQIPFGTTAGTVADGGALAATTTMIGSALQPGGSGSALVFTPTGSSSGTTGAALAALAAGAVPSSMIGAASGVASLGSNKLLTASQIPFGSAAGTVADGGALAAATTMIGSALQPGGSGSALVFTPTGSSSGTTGAALAALAAGAIPGSMIGAASGVASLGSNKLLTASQIPFGSTAGTVADGGALATAATMIGSALQPGGSGSALVFTPTGSSSGTTGAALAALAAGAVPSSMIGAASGVAALNGAKMLPTSQIPFGTTAGTVADGGMLSTVAATANAAIPSSMIGAASGVASLNGSKLLTAAQVPFGTTTGTVADGGALANTTSTLQGYMQSAATTFLGVAGNASNALVKALSDSSGRTLAAWAGDVYNIADHGADGTAANDDLAMQKAIVYATARSGTIIYIPQNLPGPSGNSVPWAFQTTSLFTFAIPSNTILAGAGINSTSITWDDNNANGYYLFGSSYNSATNSALAGIRPVNITLRDFKIIGTWTKPNAAHPSGDFTEASSDAIGVGSVDGLTIRNVESDYSRFFGMGTGYSTNVLYDGDIVYYSFADGIAAGGSSNLLVTNAKISHTNDDCASAHNTLGDTEGVRRDVMFSNIQCFDTQAIDAAAVKHGVFENITMESPKAHAISIDTAPSGTSATEGNTNISGLSLYNIRITNLMQRANIDNYTGGNTAITIDGVSARAGSYTAVPGESTTGVTKMRDPYPEWMANSQAASVAVNGGHAISLSNIQITRTFPATNGSDSRFPNWASLGQGLIAGKAALYNPTLAESDLQGDCIDFGGGYLRDVSINDLTCEGLNNGIFIINSGSATGKYDDFTIENSHFVDLSGFGIGEYITGSSTALVQAYNNDFDMDPYDKNGNRGGSGNWNSLNGCTEVAICKISGGSMLAVGNTVKNAAEDTNVDTTDPTSGWELKGNYDYAQIGVPNAFSSNQNFGIGFQHPGFEIVPIDAIPGDAAYDSITSVKVFAAAAMPTTGIWHQGDYVRNTAPVAASGSTLPIKGWLRLTTGTSDTLGTDWVADHAQ